MNAQNNTEFFFSNVMLVLFLVVVGIFIILVFRAATKEPKVSQQDRMAALWSILREHTEISGRDISFLTQQLRIKGIKSTEEEVQKCLASLIAHDTVEICEDKGTMTYQTVAHARARRSKASGSSKMVQEARRAPDTWRRDNPRPSATRPYQSQAQSMNDPLNPLNPLSPLNPIHSLQDTPVRSGRGDCSLQDVSTPASTSGSSRSSSYDSPSYGGSSYGGSSYGSSSDSSSSSSSSDSGSSGGGCD